MSFWLERFLPRSLIYHLTTVLPFLYANKKETILKISVFGLGPSTCHSRYSHVLFQLLNNRSTSKSIDRAYDSSPCLNGTGTLVLPLPLHFPSQLPSSRFSLALEGHISEPFWILRMSICYGIVDDTDSTIRYFGMLNSSLLEMRDEFTVSESLDSFVFALGRWKSELALCRKTGICMVKISGFWRLRAYFGLHDHFR